MNDPTPMTCHFCSVVRNGDTGPVWWNYSGGPLNGLACDSCHNKIEAMTPEELRDFKTSIDVAKALSPALSPHSTYHEFDQVIIHTKHENPVKEMK